MLNIKDYNNKYVINTNGQIKSASKGRLINQRLDRGGYMSVRLSMNGQTKTHYVHRLIAETFIPNPKTKPFINHINGIKTDNNIENLEWVTHAENMQHAYATGLCNKSKPDIIDKCTGKSYNSIMQASKELKICYSTCRSYLKGTIKTNKTCLEYRA
jgi:HNH endonuclease/NUMOD4 motif